MFQVIRELKVKFTEREKFEQFYDAKGDWVKFFGKSLEYFGTDVLESGESDGNKLCVINKQITLFYQLIDKKTVELLRFWNNYQNLKNL
jgi:hypothetical protein